MSDLAAAALREHCRASPARPYAWKVAINFPAGQQRLGLYHALAAPLAADRRQASDALVSLPPSSKLFVEAELGVLLSADITSVLPLEELRQRVQSYLPCLELVDYSLPSDDLPAMFAHSFFHAGVVVGEPVPAERFAALPVPFPHAVNSEQEAHARVAGVVPDDVLLAVQALSMRVLEADQVLHGGQLVLCGSYIEPVRLRAGASVSVDYGPLGTVRVRRAA